MREQRTDSIGPDGLVLPEVGDWAEDKYKLVETYSQLFTTSMKSKWRHLAYVDLFAAAGWGRVRGTERVVPGTAFCALRTPTPFDRHVLCEADPARLKALQARARRSFPKADVRFLCGDSNAIVDRILRELPGRGRLPSLLTFCVVDPSKLADLQFETIRRLAMIDNKTRRPIDFLVLIPSYMDAHREQTYYLKPSSPALATFLGEPSWRDDWRRRGQGRHPPEFGLFVVDAFGKAMSKLGYLWDIKDAILIGSAQRKFYHLAFFSRHQLGRKFARVARSYATNQLGFPWET